MVHLVLLRLVIGIILHLVPIHVQHLAMALLNGLQHRTLLVRVCVLEQDLEEIVARRIHLVLTRDKCNVRVPCSPRSSRPNASC